MADESELLAKLERWLAEQDGAVTLADVQKTGDLELVAAFTLKKFRLAAKEVVIARIQHDEASVPQGANPRPLNVVLRVFDGLARAWSLDPSEQLILLGLSSSAELAELRQASAKDVPAEVIERLAIMLDIFGLIGTLLPIAAHADSWMRSPSRAPLFAGRSPLDLMLEEDLEGMRLVRRYLRGQIAGP